MEILNQNERLIERIRILEIELQQMKFDLFKCKLNSDNSIKYIKLLEDYFGIEPNTIPAQEKYIRKVKI